MSTLCPPSFSFLIIFCSNSSFPAAFVRALPSYIPLGIFGASCLGRPIKRLVFQKETIPIKSLKEKSTEAEILSLDFISLWMDLKIEHILSRTEVLVYILPQLHIVFPPTKRFCHKILHRALKYNLNFVTYFTPSETNDLMFVLR